MRIPFFLFLALLPRLGFACPLGKGETELTIARVMRNFSHFTMPADTVAQNGTSNPDSVKDADVRDAIAGLKEAESCTRAVLDAGGKSILPSKADDLKGPDRDAYIKLYLGTMKNFLDGLTSYEGSLAALLSGGKRDFSAVQAWSDEIRNRATHAHEILQ